MNKSNLINEFLWSCAGVNKEILRLYPNEYAKYAGSGGTILFTAIMAMISGGYAMYFVFNNVVLAILFAIFWGLLIFNLDRFIVNSMHTDGKDTLSWKKLKAALPRIIMAVFLGIVISTPLEMKIFNDRIESQLIKDNIERVNEAKGESQDYVVLNSLSLELKTLSDERKQLSDELQKAQKELKEEAEGNALSGKAGHGRIYKDKEIYTNQCKKALEDWDKLHGERLSAVQKRIDEVNQHIVMFEGKIDDLTEDGFSARFEAFSNLKNANSALATVSLMITLLFIIIEVTPTFFKLIMTHGPYDEHLQIENYKISAYAIKQRGTIETQLKIAEYENNKMYKQMTTPVIDNMYGSSNPQQLTITHESQEHAELPYKSNTNIVTSPKKPTRPEYKTNQYGQLMLNFGSKNRTK